MWLSCGADSRFSLIVSGNQVDNATLIGHRDPIDLNEPSTLAFFSTRMLEVAGAMSESEKALLVNVAVLAVP